MQTYLHGMWVSVNAPVCAWSIIPSILYVDMAYIFTRHITVTHWDLIWHRGRTKPSGWIPLLLYGPFIHINHFGFGASGTRGRLVNSSVVFLLGGFRSTRESRACSTDRDSTRGESTVKDPFDINQSDSAAWHTAAPYRFESKTWKAHKCKNREEFPDDK